MITDKEYLSGEIRLMIARIAEDFEGNIQGDESLKKELGFDSMMGLELSVNIENKFGVKISDEELAKLDSLNQTVKLVNRLMG